jgi:hypothetical protein
MSITGKILLGLNFVATLGLFFMASRTLKLQENWRSAAEKLEQGISAAELQQQQLIEGNQQQELGILQLQVALHNATVGRGNVWREVTPLQADATPEDGKVSVSVQRPSGMAIADNAVVFVFDAAKVTEQGRYLGEFKVTQIAEDQLVLASSQRMSADEITAVSQSSGPWILHEVMPADDHEIFNEMSDEQLTALLGPGGASLAEDILQQYLRDEQEADPNDPEERVIVRPDGSRIYSRRLRDYLVIFHTYARERADLADLINGAKKDLKSLQVAQADVEAQIAFRQQQKADLEQIKQYEETARDTVVQFHDLVEQRLAAIQEENDQLIAENKRLASVWATSQREALEEALESAN